MSLGVIFTYGDFKFYTAGDFSDGWNLPNGERFEIEDAIATWLSGRVSAKINHHGHKSMTDKLVAALRPRVVVNNVWDQLHTLLRSWNVSITGIFIPASASCVLPCSLQNVGAEDAGQRGLIYLTPRRLMPVM